MLNRDEPGIFLFEGQTYFDDMDGLWVLHHSKYLVHLEHAVMALFYESMQADGFDSDAYPDLYQVVSKVDIQYLRPIDTIGVFYIALSVERVREAALTLRFAFLDKALHTVHARGLRSCCKLSKKTHEPCGWSANFRHAYEARLDASKSLSDAWRSTLVVR